MPHIRKRGKIYYCYWYENGRHHSKAISPNLSTTKEWIAGLHNRLYARKNGVIIRNFLFSDFCREYIEKHSKATKRERTQKKDVYVIASFIKKCPSIAYTSQFDDKALAEYISIRKKDDISDATINRELGLLKNMQSYAPLNLSA
jgi:hypothetical protein